MSPMRIVAVAVLLAWVPGPLGAECVVMLHGLARTHRSMAPLERAFEERGYRVVNVDYPSRSRPIAELADRYVAAGLEACSARKGEKVHVVAHSLGGILVRSYASRHGAEAFGRVVMLAPPNQGSEVIDSLAGLPGFAWFYGPAALALGTGPQSVPLALGPVSFEAGVVAGTRTVNPVLSLLLPNPDDGKVSVERAKVEGMADFITVPHSHPFIMKDPAVIEQCLRFVETGRFRHDPS